MSTEQHIDPEVIRAMEAAIHDFTQYRGGYGRLTPDERAEAMEVALRAADEKQTSGMNIYSDVEHKAINYANTYTTGGLLLALQNAISEADAYESTPYNLRVLAARALIIARRKENPNDPLVAPSMVHRDR